MKLPSVNLKLYKQEPNIGDRFSLAVAHRYFSSCVVPYDNTELTVPNIILVGSVLQFADAYSHVCGAGYISPEPRYLLRTRPASVNCVRGPLTGLILEKQGVSHPHLYADPGILAPFIYPQNAWSCGGTIGLIPHSVDAGATWVDSCRKKGLKIVNVFSPPETFFAELNQCEVILSSSLHGIIFAHAYGKPALWIELSDKVIGSGFKFYDYYLSVGIGSEKVARVRIKEDTNPFEIVNLATVVSHAPLHTALQEAMDKTVRQLAHSQEPAGVLK